MTLLAITLYILSAAQGSHEAGQQVTAEERGAVFVTTLNSSLTGATFHLNGTPDEVKQATERTSCSKQVVHSPTLGKAINGWKVPRLATFRLTLFSGVLSDGSYWLALFDDKNPYRAPTGMRIARRGSSEIEISYFPHNEAKAQEIRLSIRDGSYMCKWKDLQALPGRYLHID